MLLLVIEACLSSWRTAGGLAKPFQRMGSTPVDDVESSSLAALPTYTVDGLPRLRFARELLSADTNVLQELICEEASFWSLPLSKTLLPRHAFLRARGLPHGSHLLRDHRHGLQQLLLRPQSDAQFATAVANLSSPGVRPSELCLDFASFASRFRKGGFDAARAGDTAVLEALLAHGWCARTARDKRGASALHYAAGHGHVECCALLCAAGLEVDDRAQDGATPLHWAVAGMTSRGNSRDHADDRQGRDSAGPNGFGTGGHLGMAKWLVGRGADVGAQTVDGNSILHWCAWAGTLEVLTWLTDHIRQLQRSGLAMHGGGTSTTSDGSCSLSGASPSKLGKRTSDSLSVHALNRNGCSAAHWAASGGGLAVCQWLAEELELDFSLPNLEGNTPLTKAIEHGREEIVRGSPLIATNCHYLPLIATNCH